jgi:hypothetical protein
VGGEAVGVNVKGVGEVYGFGVEDVPEPGAGLDVEGVMKKVAEWGEDNWEGGEDLDKVRRYLEDVNKLVD